MYSSFFHPCVFWFFLEKFNLFAGVFFTIYDFFNLELCETDIGAITFYPENEFSKVKKNMASILIVQKTLIELVKEA